MDMICYDSVLESRTPTWPTDTYLLLFASNPINPHQNPRPILPNRFPLRNRSHLDGFLLPQGWICSGSCRAALSQWRWSRYCRVARRGGAEGRGLPDVYNLAYVLPLFPLYPQSPSYLMQLHVLCFILWFPVLLVFCQPKILNEIPITIFRLQACFHLLEPFETYYCMWSYQLLRSHSHARWLSLYNRWYSMIFLCFCWWSLRFPVFQWCVSTRPLPPLLLVVPGTSYWQVAEIARDEQNW